MKQISYLGIEVAWKNHAHQPIKDRESKVYLNMLDSWQNQFEWRDCKRSRKRRLALTYLSQHGKLAPDMIHDCEIEEIHEDLMLAPGRRATEAEAEFWAREKREIEEMKTKGTYREVVPTRNTLPDWREYLVESVMWDEAEWAPIIAEIDKLQPYILGSENAMQLDMIGELMRIEHKRRDRDLALKRAGIDWELAFDFMQLSVGHAESAIYKIEHGHPIGTPKRRKSTGASAKTEALENQKIDDEHGLVGFKKPIEIGSMSKEDAIQGARLAVMGEWNRIKFAFKPARRRSEGFFFKSKNLRRHLARIGYRAALRELTSWEGWREKGWLEQARNKKIEDEIADAPAPVFDERVFIKSKPRWVNRLNKIALEKGLLKSKEGRREHKKFLKMIECFLKGRNPNKRSNHLQVSLKRYGIAENTRRRRRIENLEKWAPFFEQIGRPEVAKAKLEVAKKLRKRAPKSLESYLCNLPLLDS